jgi:coenzyme F420-0:L-glutamate ligase/coenzyme F420-1:gamma-L-glutamate ligase
MYKCSKSEENPMSHNLLDMMKNRQSIRKYSSQKISQGVISSILEAVRWAPSAHNSQPWRFIVIQDHNTKKRLAGAMAKRWEKQLKTDGVTQEQRESLIEASIERFTHPPVIIIACMTMEDMDKYPDTGRKKAEFIMAVQSVAAALENLLLAAQSKGLGTCWYCAPLFCQDEVRKILKIPQTVDSQALITLGYTAGKPSRSPRKSLDTVIHQEMWRVKK